MVKPLRRPRIQAKLAGFNASPRADRTSKEAFLNSYLYAFPERKEELERNLTILDAWLTRILSKEIIKPTKVKKEWVPRNQWIPDNPYPKSSYKWEATNIARAIRKSIDNE